MTRAERDRQVFPHLEERLGEDPARFLDREILTTPAIRRLKTTDAGPRYVPDVDVADPLECIASRIRGIDRLGVIGAWQGVEERLLRTPEGGRDQVNELLQARARELEASGGREEAMQHQREVVVEADQDDGVDEPTVWRHEKCGTTDVEQESSRTWFCATCEQRTNRVEAVEAAEVAA